MQHTPGPWTVSPVIRKDLDDDPMGEYVIREAQDRLTPLYWKAEPESYEIEAVHDENYANARLVAAAPELLDALQQAINLTLDEDDPTHHAFMINASIAIKKALNRK